MVPRRLAIRWMLLLLSLVAVGARQALKQKLRPLVSLRKPNQKPRLSGSRGSLQYFSFLIQQKRFSSFHKRGGLGLHRGPQCRGIPTLQKILNYLAVSNQSLALFKVNFSWVKLL